MKEDVSQEYFTMSNISILVHTGWPVIGTSRSKRFPHIKTEKEGLQAEKK